MPSVSQGAWEHVDFLNTNAHSVVFGQFSNNFYLTNLMYFQQ